MSHDEVKYGFFSLQHAKKILDPLNSGFDVRYDNLAVWRNSEGKEFVLTAVLNHPDSPNYMFDDKVAVGVVTEYVRAATMEDCIKHYPDLSSFISNPKFTLLKKQDGLYVNINPLLSKFNKK